MKKLAASLLTAMILFFSCSEKQDQFISKWDKSDDRIWGGPDFWANPLQDWQVTGGRLECSVTGPNRSYHLISWSLSGDGLNFETSVNLQISSQIVEKGIKGWAGFVAGARGRFNDYRDDAVYGQGIHAGITSGGILFIGDPGKDGITSDPLPVNMMTDGDLRLLLEISNVEGDSSLMILNAFQGREKKSLAKVERVVPDGDMEGNIALKADFEGKMNGPERLASAWFSNWKAKGPLLQYHPEQAFGPVLFTMYTLSKGILKLTAQMAPISGKDEGMAVLEIKNSQGAWEKAAEAAIDPMSFTATFRYETGALSGNLPYRVVYSWGESMKAKRTFKYDGSIRMDPVDKEEIVVAAFTGNHDFGFPNNEIVENVLKHNPDLLVFTGDQIYEPRGGFGYMTEPVDLATLDYLRKWFMVGWEYGDMLRNIPSVIIPDDHDVYHGNIWGCGGKAAKKSADVKEWQDDGGYKMPPDWVNMVERTQTSHLPDPFDPAPVDQGISVYYCDLNIGGISFAVIEDRKWKSAPKAHLPEYLKVINGWAENNRFNDPGVFDVEADLLGERQMSFLGNWVSDWSNNTYMKAVISQTIFSTVATLPDSAVSDVIVPKLRITQPGEYPENDIPTQDMDSNGWPKKGRDAALRLIRKAYAFHIAGDQHLATTIRYGVDNWGDAGYAICVPSISNYFPRRWFPAQEGRNRNPGDPKYLGGFLDGFGNKMTVLAVANPVVTGMKPAILYDRSTGYGIVRFNKKSRAIEIANWPRNADPENGGKPYEGWPLVISQFDNYGREAYAWLPVLKIEGTPDPVAEVYHQDSGELEYAVRISGREFSPRVFRQGKHRVRIGYPDENVWKVIENIDPVTKTENTSMTISF